ncbi:MAG: ADP-glyceromanno-heptose 6-epimerase [Candidatus Kapaibacteriales bacterium]
MVVVTGGSGFIGSCLVDALNKKGINDILVVDHMGESDKWKNLYGKRFTDYLDRDDFRSVLSSELTSYPIDAIYHLGACSATTEKDVLYLMDNNYQYSKEVFLLAQEVGAKFIYASSAATYGLGENGYSDNLDLELKPLNAYGFSKYAFDRWLIENGYIDDALGLKFFNVFGPNEYHKGDMASMVFKAWKQIKSTGKIKLFKSNFNEYADGDQRRDFIYVKDAVSATLALADNGSNGIYNIGTGKAHSWNELMKAVFKSLGVEPDIEYIDMPERLKGQYQNFTEADMDKFHKALNGNGFKFTDLEESVADYVVGYLEKGQKTI